MRGGDIGQIPRQDGDRSGCGAGVGADLLLVLDPVDRAAVCGLGAGRQQAHLKEFKLRKGVSALIQSLLLTALRDPHG